MQTHPTQASDESGGPGLTATTFSAFEGNLKRWLSLWLTRPKKPF